MQSRWILSIVCLVVLGSVLVAGQSSTATGQSDPPQNFVIVRAVGCASDANLANLNSSTVNTVADGANNFGSQAQLWLAFGFPQNLGNDPSSGNRDYGITISPNTSAASFSCTQVTGAVCTTSTSTSGAAASLTSAITTTFATMAIHYFDQGIVEGTAYTLAAYTQSNLGQGTSSNTQQATIPYSGNPIKPTTPTFTYVTPSSFVINFQAPQYLGQKGNGILYPAGNAIYQLVSPYYEVQIRYPAGSTADTNYSNWYVVSFNANPFGNGIVASTGGPSALDNTGVVEQYTTLPAATFGTYLVTAGAYLVRVRAVGQWGKGVWSAAGSVTTAATKSTPNAVSMVPAAVTINAFGGIYAWSSLLATAQSGNLYAGSLGGKGTVGSGASIQSYTVQWSFTAGAANTNGLGTSTSAVGVTTSWYSWNSTSETPGLIRSQGRVVGGYVGITSSFGSGTGSFSAWLIANPTHVVSFRVLTSNENGAGTLPPVGTWLNSAVANTATAAIPNITPLTCWGIKNTGTPANSTSACQFTFKPSPSLATNAFAAFTFTPATASNWSVAPTMPSTLIGANMRWDIGLDNADPTAAANVQVYADYGVFTATGFATSCSNASTVGEFTVQYGSIANALFLTTTFQNAVRAITSDANCSDTTSGKVTFQKRAAATPTMGTAALATTVANDAILAMGYDYALLWVNRPVNGGSDSANNGKVVYAFAPAVATPTLTTGTIINTNGNTSSANFSFFNGSTLSSSQTDLNFVVGVQFPAGADAGGPFSAGVKRSTTTLIGVASSTITNNAWAAGNYYFTGGAAGGAGDTSGYTAAEGNFWTATTTVGNPAKWVPVDVSDYAVNLLFTFPSNAGATPGTATAGLGGSWTSNSIPSFSITFPTSTVEVPVGNAVTTSTLTCSGLSATNNVPGANFYYLCSTVLPLPGRKYNLLPRLNIGATATTGTALTALSFYSSTERPSNSLATSSTSGVNTPKNNYYYATFAGFTLFRSVQTAAATSFGQGGASSRSLGATPWPAGAAAASAAYVVWGAPTATAQRDIQFAYAAAAATLATAQSGAGWHALTITNLGAAASGTITPSLTGNSIAYSINTSIVSNINQAAPATIAVTTGTQAATNYATLPQVITTSGNVRRITNNAMWFEFEAHATSNLSNAVWTFTSVCGSAASFNPTGTAVSAGSLNTSGINFLLASLDYSSQTSGSACTVQVNFGSGASAGALSTSVSVTLSKNTAPLAPATPVFDQITSGSFVVYVGWPTDFGTSGITSAGLNTAAVSNIVLTQASVSANTGNAIFDVNNATPSATSTTYQDQLSYQSGVAVRVTGYTIVSPASTPTVAANTGYTVAVTVTSATANSGTSTAASATVTSNRNGDIPAAPAITSVMRITSSSVRLFFNRPINVGGNIVSGYGATPAGVGYRVWGFETGQAATGYLPLTFSLTTPSTYVGAIPGYYGATYPQMNYVGFIADVTGISPTTTGRNFVFYVNADNCFSATIAGNWISGTSSAINMSAASAVTNIPAASGVAPGAALTPVITSYSDVAISFSWAENALWGSTAVTGYKITRQTGGTGTFSSLGTAVTLSYQDTALTVSTAYSYNIVATNSLDATAANVGTTTMAANSAPGAPTNAPVVIQYADSLIRVYWAQPIPLGGLQGTLASPNIGGYRLTQTYSSGVAAETCNLVFSWVGNSAITSGISTSSDSYFYYTTSQVIPGKTYAFNIAASNVVTIAPSVTPVTQVGAATSATTQTANYVVRPYPAPVVAYNVIGAGYVSFTIAAPGTYQSIGTSYGIPSSYVGYQILQMSPYTNQTGSAFVPDRVWDYTGQGLGVTPTLFYANELLALSKYRFKVQSTNGFQQNQSVAEVTNANGANGVTTLSAIVPGAINTVTSVVTMKRSNSITLGWAAPVETGGKGALTQFKVTYLQSGQTVASVNTTAPYIAYNTWGVSTYAMQLSGLQANTQYTIQVFGINTVGTSAAASSFPSVDVTNGLNSIVLTGQVPNLPTGLAVVTNNNTPALTLSWTVSTAGSTVTTAQTFSVQTTADNVASASITPASITTAQSAVSGVVAGGLYRFQLYSTNSLGNSELSATLIVQVVPTTSTNANPIPGAIGVPTLTGYSANEYRLSWAADTVVTNTFNSAYPTVNTGAAYTIAYWRVYNRFYATSTVPITNESGPLQTQMVGPGSAAAGASPSMLATCAQIVYTIAPSTQYMVTVAGKNSSAVWGGFSTFGFSNSGNALGFKPQMTQTATASAPTQLQVQDGTGAIGNNSFSIQWMPGTWGGMDFVYQYRVTVSREYGSNLIINNVPNTNTTNSNRAVSPVTFTQTGLLQGTSYIVNIRGVNSFGPSIPSQNLRVVTTGQSGFAAQTSFLAVVLMTLAAILAFAF